MKAENALHTMIEKTGTNKAELSRAIGRSDRFVSTTLGKGSIPRLDTMAALADVMGYELVLRGHGDEIVIDPPSAE